MALLIVSLVAPIVFGATVQTTLDRASVMAGESTTLKLIVEGASPQSVESFPAIPGLSIQFAGRSQEFTSVNGQSSFRHVLNFQVTPARPGSYRIPAIDVVVEGQRIASQPVQLNVTKADSAQQNQQAFLRLLVPRNEIFVGEVIPIEVQLYVAGRGDNLQPPKLESDGFVINKQADHTLSNTQIGNTPYSVVSFKMAISAAKAGQLELGPAEVSFTLLVPVQRNPNDPFSSFFGQRYQRRAVTLRSLSHSIRVLPLPTANVPPSFTGAIGEFQWTVSASPTNLNAGDPVTLRVAIIGQGNWDSVQLPAFGWTGWKTYSPNSSLETSDPLGLQGQKTFEQVIVPEHSDISEVPQVQFSFFDPERRSYRTLTSRATPVSVQPGGGPQVQPALTDIPDSPGEQELPRNDIVHIKPDPGALLALSAPLLRQPWFLIIQVLPVLALAAATLWRKRQEQLANNPRLRRRIQVEKTVAAGLDELRAHAREGRAEEFYATVFRLLQEQLGERLDLPAYSITEAALDEHLPGRQASPELIARLHQLFQICNQARYAVAGFSGNMQGLIPQVEQTLKELQAIPA